MLTESGLINYHNFSGLVITVRRGAALAFTNEALTNEKTLWIATDPTYTENRAGELYVATFFSNEPFAKIPKDAEISPIRIDYLALTFNNMDSFILRLNSIFTGRPNLWNQYFSMYTPRLFGIEI